MCLTVFWVWFLCLAGKGFGAGNLKNQLFEVIAMATCQYSTPVSFGVLTEDIHVDRVFVTFSAPTKVRDLLTVIPAL